MFRKNTSGQFISVQLLLTASGAIATGLSPTVRRCIDGTFAAGDGTVTEDTGTGFYKYAMSQADTNGNNISFMFTATGAMPVCVNIVTATAAGADLADVLLDRDMSTGADSGSTTVRTVRQALRFLRNKWSISGGTLTVCKEDDSTTSWTGSVTTDAAADPITANDPAGP